MDYPEKRNKAITVIVILLVAAGLIVGGWAIWNYVIRSNDTLEPIIIAEATPTDDTMFSTNLGVPRIMGEFNYSDPPPATDPPVDMYTLNGRRSTPPVPSFNASPTPSLNGVKTHINILYDLNRDDLTAEQRNLHITMRNGSDSYSEGIFNVWWDKRYNYRSRAIETIRNLNQVRDFNKSLGLPDPPNIERGRYYNIYFHETDRPDVMPDFWGNGQGTDVNGFPFLTISPDSSSDLNNLTHEGTHIFQYGGSVPYGGDTGWYIEASANWATTENLPTDTGAWITSSAVAHHPQLRLWQSVFFNKPYDCPEDPCVPNSGNADTCCQYVNSWGYGNHQYGMHNFLNYLTMFCDVSRQTIMAPFYQSGNVNPQRYFYSEIGPDNMRKCYLRFAAELAADYAFMSQEQRDATEREWNSTAGGGGGQAPAIRNERIAGEFGPEGTTEFRPSEQLATEAWSYNTYRLNGASGPYTFTIRGDMTGSKGTMSYFRGMVVTVQNNVWTFQSLIFASPISSSGTVNIPAGADVYFVVASMPAVFEGVEKFLYTIDISPN